MKKRLLAFVLMLTVTTSLPLNAQTDSLTTDSAQVDEIEVYSDTTQNDSAAAVPVPVDADDDFPFGNSQDTLSILDNFDMKDLGGMLFVLAILFILFVLAPLTILGLVLWFVYKNRKDRMRLAEMAMKNGQPIPDELVGKTPDTTDDLRAKGIRQIFLGIGLIFLLGWAASKVGAGIGIVVLCIGLGNVLIARSHKNKVDDGLTDDDFNRPANDLQEP